MKMDPDLSALAEQPTEQFLENISSIARTEFDCASFPQTALTTDDWKKLFDAGVILPIVPRKFGGRENHREMVEVLERIAEWNLPVSFYAKITAAVALRPLIAWASPEALQEVLPEFVSGDPVTCGLALTEPERGTSLAGMTTTFEKVEGGYRIRGRKHWQGFSATARWWVVCAKEKDGREFGYFIVRRDEGFETIEDYDAIGMRAIDYGLNVIDAVVPEYRRLETDGSDLSAVVEVLMAPRALMPAVGSGLLRRIDRDARAYVGQRSYGRATLDQIPFVRYRLDCITASSTICRALSHYVKTKFNLCGVMSPHYPQVQAIKTVATENMVTASNHYVQLMGGEGYRRGASTNTAALAFLDTRVFPIFDGNNDLLSQQLAQYCSGQAEESTLSSFLERWPSTARAVRRLNIDISFLDQQVGQERVVIVGRIISYLFAVECLMLWTEEESSEDIFSLTDDAIIMLSGDIRRCILELDVLAELSTFSVTGAAR